MKGCPRSLIPVGAHAHERRVADGRARPAARRAALAWARPPGLRWPRGAPRPGTDQRLHRLRCERPVAPCRPPAPGVPAHPPPAVGRPSGHRHRRGDGDDRRPVGQVERAQPPRRRHDRRELGRAARAARALPRLLARPDPAADGEQPRLAGADAGARVPARHRHATSPCPTCSRRTPCRRASRPG